MKTRFARLNPDFKLVQPLPWLRHLEASASTADTRRFAAAPSSAEPPVRPQTPRTDRQPASFCCTT